MDLQLIQKVVMVVMMVPVVQVAVAVVLVDLTQMELVDQVVKENLVNFHLLTVPVHSHFTLVEEGKME